MAVDPLPGQVGGGAGPQDEAPVAALGEQQFPAPPGGAADAGARCRLRGSPGAPSPGRPGATGAPPRRCSRSASSRGSPPGPSWRGRGDTPAAHRPARAPPAGGGRSGPAPVPAGTALRGSGAPRTTSGRTVRRRRGPPAAAACPWRRRGPGAARRALQVGRGVLRQSCIGPGGVVGELPLQGQSRPLTRQSFRPRGRRLRIPASSSSAGSRSQPRSRWNSR